MKFATSLGRSALAGAIGMAMCIAGCDWYAQKNLVVGQNTELDVRRIMGRPEMVWEEDSGEKRLEYPRGPNSNQTHFVYIDRNGRYQGMEQALNATNFAKVREGMTDDDVRHALGKPTEDIFYRLKNERVWSWTYDGDAGTKMSFNVHFDAATHKVARVTRTQDIRHSGA